MTREEAKIAAIEFAKAAMSSKAGTVSVYPSSASAKDVADFINKTLSSHGVVLSCNCYNDRSFGNRMTVPTNQPTRPAGLFLCSSRINATIMLKKYR